MNKTKLVNAWICRSGANRQFASKGKAFSLGWKLLNDYLSFLESGCCPETKVPLYDFTHFLDTFADLYAGSNDELYHWIVSNGHTIIEVIQERETVGEEIPNTHCPLCSVPLTNLNVARSQEGHIRTSAMGRAWCKECAQRVDGKNWLLSD